MLTARRMAWIAVLSLALSGCSLFGGVSSFLSGGSCGGGAQKLLGQVNWAEAEVLEVRIRQGQFTPALLRMRQGLPYIVRLTNADDWPRKFSAPEFFSAVAVDKVLIGTSEERDTCIRSVSVPSHDVVEIHLIAGRDGRYTFEDQFFLLPILPGGVGIVTISPDNFGRPGSMPAF